MLTSTLLRTALRDFTRRPWQTGLMILGSYHARTAMAELDESKQAFERAFQISGNHSLLQKYNYAIKYLCAKADRAQYKAVLEDISYDYLIQIQRYGKKLSTMTLFFLLFAVVFPSLLMTIAIILLSFTGLSMTMGFFTVVLVVVAFIQVVFLQMFRSIRPGVTL